jgi:ABC-type dipeptide/oligopeptide/nickel transport system permease component
MWTFIARRLLLALVVLFGVTVLTFSMIHMLPGDPVQIMYANTTLTPQQMHEIRHALGLDQPFLLQYVHYLLNVLHGDFGTSIINQQPVLQKIDQQLPSSLELAASSMLVAIVVGFVLGIVAGSRPNTWLDTIMTFLALLGVSIPGFLLAFFLIFFFSLHLGWLPSVGSQGFDHLILPSFALGLGYAAILARLLRSSLIEVGGMQYVLTARGRGFTRSRVLMRHMLRNALIPVVTMLALQFGNMLSGAVLIEVIFGRQGIGHLLVDGIMGRDYPVVQGIVLFIAVVYVVANLLVDVLYGIIDPRIHHA